MAPQNPLKPKKGMAPLEKRLAAAAIVADHPRLRVTDIESRLRTRYTADTLICLRRHFPRARFVWLMGADNLAQLPGWRNWTRILAELPVAVFDRSPYSYKALAGKAAHRYRRALRPPRLAPVLAECASPAWVFLHRWRHPASATAIRGSQRKLRQETAKTQAPAARGRRGNGQGHRKEQRHIASARPSI